MTLENLVSIQGPLVETVPEFKPETIQHADEITTQRRDNQELRGQWFWTADFPLYRLEKGKPILRLARGKNNLLFQNLEDAANQLINDGNYFPEKEDIPQVTRAKTTLKVDLSELDLQRHSHEYSFFEINTEDYESLNPEQRKFAERVYGSGEDFQKNMEMLGQAGIRKTKIYTLNPEYVEATLKEKKAPALARASWLDDFAYDSDFVADGRGVGDPDGRLLGVRREKEVGEADAPEKSETKPVEIDYQTALCFIRDHQTEMSDHMDKTDALIFLSIGTEFYKKQ